MDVAWLKIFLFLCRVIISDSLEIIADNGVIQKVKVESGKCHPAACLLIDIGKENLLGKSTGVMIDPEFMIASEHAQVIDDKTLEPLNKKVKKNPDDSKTKKLWDLSRIKGFIRDPSITEAHYFKFKQRFILDNCVKKYGDGQELGTDLVLLQLKDPLTLNVDYPKISELSNIGGTNKKVKIFGFFEHEGFVLKSATSKLADHKMLQDTYPSYRIKENVKTNHLLLSPDEGVSISKGDSGGPLISDQDNTGELLGAAVKYIPDKNQKLKQKISVYTNLGYYKSVIERIKNKEILSCEEEVVGSPQTTHDVASPPSPSSNTRITIKINIYP